MKNKSSVLWLTGASSGIGEAFAEAAARAGYRVALTARRADLLEALVERLIASGAAAREDIISAPGDVTSLGDMETAAHQVRSQLGEIDILVANAGTHVPTRVDSFHAAEVAHLMSVNFMGAMNCIEVILPAMLERKSGHIVAVSSVAGYRGLPFSAAYCASKSALTAAMESLRFELEPRGIAVSVVSPGFVKTPLTDKNDFPMPFVIGADEAARAMLKGIARRDYEIHFPKRFTWLMKSLRVIPFPLYHRIVRGRTGGE